MTILSIWDSTTSIPKDLEPLLWVENALSDKNHKSIFDIIEQNDDYIKNEYQDYIYDLGKIKVYGESIEHKLEIKKGFSYWWMTLIFEKCNFSKSQQIDNLIKILALKKKICEEDIKQINLYTHDRKLKLALLILTEELNIKLKCKILSPLKRTFKEYLKTIIPRSIQSFIWIIFFYAKTRKLNGLGLNEWENSKAELTFVTWSTYQDSNELNNKHFVSNYWANLPDAIAEKAHHTNWLHILLEDKNFNFGEKGVQSLKLLNGNTKLQTHMAIYSFFDASILLSTFSDWCLLMIKSIGIQRSLQDHNKRYLWPYLKDDWLESIFGKTSIYNLLMLNLLNRAMKSLKKQKLCVYLMENQPWESALNYSIKEYGHLRTLGFPHTTIRFWDLRYSTNRKNFEVESELTLPYPDLIGSSGKVMNSSLINNGYPKRKLIDIEALRFLFLLDTKSSEKNLKIRNKTPELLVLGDYVNQVNIDMLNVLDAAAKTLDYNLNITFKPHPYTPVDLDMFPNLELKEENKDIYEIYLKYDFAFCSSQTSASLDAYFLGMNVLNFSDPVSLNLNPLYKITNATFIKGYKQLVLALNEQRNQTSALSVEQFFNLERNLNKWLLHIEKELSS